MDLTSDGIKDCCRKLTYLEGKCVTQQGTIETLTKELLYLQEKVQAQETMLQDAFSYVRELEQKFNQHLLKE